MLFIGCGDIHFQESYIHRLDNVRKTFEMKFHDIFNHAIAMNAEAILLTGDIFNQKNSKNISYSLMSFIIGLFSQAPCKIYSIIGNHDTIYNDINRIYKHPLGVLFKARVIHRLTHEIFQKRNEKEVLIRGYDYGYDLPSLPISNKNDFFNIAITHCHMAANPGTYFGNEKIHGFDELRGLGADIILNGHDHTPYPIIKHKFGTISRPGALFRTTRGKEDLERSIQISVIDTEKGTVEHIQVEHEDSSKVFDFNVKQIELESQTEIGEFISTLQSMDFKSKKSIDEEIRTMKISKDIIEMMTNYLERVKKL